MAMQFYTKVAVVFGLVSKNLLVDGLVSSNPVLVSYDVQYTPFTTSQSLLSTTSFIILVSGWLLRVVDDH